MGLDVQVYPDDIRSMLTGLGDDELRSRALALFDWFRSLDVDDVDVELTPTTHPNLFITTYDLGPKYITWRIRVRGVVIACARGTGKTLWILAVYPDPGSAANRDIVLARLAPLALLLAEKP